MPMILSRSRKRLICAAVMSGTVLAGIAAVAAAAGGAWKVWRSPNVGGSDDNYLVAAAASSSSSVWAVGYYKIPSRRTLIEHWDGKAWRVQPSPNVGGATRDNWFYGVAATSSTNAWAVGHVGFTGAQTLIEHWDGRAWRVQPSPNPGGSALRNSLEGVAATSSSNAWAVGRYGKGNGTAVRTLIEHWNGTAWNVQPSPNAGLTPNGQFHGAAATSPNDAWAVGHYNNGKTPRTLIEHWNGTAWTIQPSPNSGGSSASNDLNRVAATSATNAWAVGHYNNGSSDQTLIEHWNGRSWTVQESPNPGGPTRLNILKGVAAPSATNAWAVGSYYNGTAYRTLIEHWNGTAWTVQKSPNPAGTPHANRLWDVTSTSPTNVWMVGSDDNGTADRTLALHCC